MPTAAFFATLAVVNTMTNALGNIPSKRKAAIVTLLETCRPAKRRTFQFDPTADLTKWRAFLAIAELGSLTRAARLLNSNQSPPSRHLNALERECNAATGRTSCGRAVRPSSRTQTITLRAPEG